MFNPLTPIKNHISRHRTKYAVVATATVTTVAFGAILINRAEEWNEFLQEQGVYEAWEAHLEETSL